MYSQFHTIWNLASYAFNYALVEQNTGYINKKKRMQIQTELVVVGEQNFSD